PTTPRRRAITRRPGACSPRWPSGCSTCRARGSDEAPQAGSRAPAGYPGRGPPDVIVHLVDGTYELFRYFMAPAYDRATPEALRAVRGVVGSLLAMLEDGVTHVGVATDHVIESFRNGLWPGYKTGEGIDPLLRARLEPLEEALAALGVVVWPMVEHEADDALATAASMAADQAPRERG